MFNTSVWGFILAQGSDEYVSLVEALPSEAIAKFPIACDETKTSNNGASTSNEDAREMVSGMKTLEDLRGLLVRVITTAKSPEVAAAKSEETYAISDALKDFAWGDFKVGTDIIWR